MCEKKITELLKLKQEEERLVMQHCKVMRNEKEMNEIQKGYGEQFTHSDELFERLAKTFQNSRSRQLFDELFIEAKSEQQCIYEQLAAEKELLGIRKEALESRENQIFYEIRRLSAELESD